MRMYSSELQSQVDEKQRKEATIEEMEKSHPTQPLTDKMSRPGNGAPLRGPDGKIITHLHHSVTGNVEEDIQQLERDHVSQGRYRSVLDKHVNYRRAHPEESHLNPAYTEPAPLEPEELRAAHPPTDIMNKRGHRLNNIHERQTSDYLEFGLPGGGAPRLDATKTEIDTHVPPKNPLDPVKAREYALTLEKARQQKQEIMRRLKEEDQKLEAGMKDYNPFGKPGAGAPYVPQRRQEQDAPADVSPTVPLDRSL